MSLVAQLNAALKRRLEANLIIAGEIVATEVRKSIERAPRGGKTYQRKNASGSYRTVTASAAGESPATDLGFLVRSIQIEPDLQNLRVRILSLHSIAPYAKRLEYGDLSRGLQPRPFMFKGLQAKKQQAIAIVQNAVNQAIRDMQGVPPI
ncbi:MAG: hypothetical protein IPJ47_15375 [Anaerolineales bacterium]|nr:hypothetical protein [Anaerolineales bacterium]